MSNFNYWKNEIADIPELQNGVWVDLEDGIAFDPSFNYLPKSEKKPLSEKSLAARKEAKFFGAKALKGSKKQKEWAEKIRANIIKDVSEDQALKLCDPKSISSRAKFWIENRNKPAHEFGKFIDRIKKILDIVKEHGKSEDLITEYNNLTTEWGFE